MRYVQEVKYGTLHIKLGEMIKEAGLSKNKLSHKAEMQRTRINNTVIIRSLGWTLMSWQGYVLYLTVRIVTCWILYLQRGRNDQVIISPVCRFSVYVFYAYADTGKIFVRHDKQRRNIVHHSFIKCRTIFHPECRV